ncbi:MAG: P-loop NTPase [Candidatus Aureabacteria bacterium]|nr:P-loop NTPase [Candidatus Auribacterota bacterium]
MDPRVNIIDKRLEKVKKVVAVSGGKGGIGKSTFAAILALTLSKRGHNVGLLDLDFWGPSAHVILGAEKVLPEEKEGIIPPDIHNLKFMTIMYYTADKALTIRKAAFENAVLELLSVVQWGALDYLIMDMPPGIGDPTLDVIRLMKKVRFCVIAAQSQVVMETVIKTLNTLIELKISITGVVQNMKMNERSVREQIERLHVPFLGEIEFDAGLEEAMGNPDDLLQTGFAKAIDRSIAGKLENF